MIKINLLKSFGAASPESMIQLDEVKNVQRQFAIRMFVLCLGIGGLFVYEKINVPSLEVVLAEKNRVLQETAEFNKQRESIKAEILKYEKDSTRLNRQTEFLQKIQFERALPLSFINKIKEVIPTNLWLTSLQISGDTIDLVGEAESEKDINEFNLKLASIEFLKDVIVLSIELKKDKLNIGVPVKIFNMKAQLAPTRFFAQEHQ